MKTKVLFLNITTLFFLVVFCQTCDSSDGLLLERLEEIREKGDSVPLEAFQDLEELSDDMQDESEYVCMKYGLLKIRLQDKSYIVPENDKQAKKIYAFFEKKGSRNEKAEASYYLASVYRDLHDSPRAVRCFLQSVDYMKRCDKIDTFMLANAYSQLCTLYRRQFNYEAMLEMSLREYELIQINRKLMDPIRIMDVATSYHYLQDTINAIKYQNIALQEILHDKAGSSYPDVVAELMSNYLKQGEIEKSELCKRIMDSIPPSIRPANYYINMGEYYKHKGEIDNAIYYYSIVYSTAKFPTYKYDGVSNLLHLYLEKGEAKKIKEFSKLFLSSVNEVMLFLNIEQSTNAHNEYVYQKDKEAEELAFQEAETAKRNLIIAVLALLVLIMTSIVIFQKFRLRSMRKNNEQKDVIDSQIEKLRQQLMIIESKEKELKDASKELNEKDQLLKQKDKQKEMLYQVAYRKQLEGKSEDVYDKFILASEGRAQLKDEDWENLFAVVDELDPTFRDAVLEKIASPKEDILRITYLLKAGMTNTQIVRITNYANTTVWRKADRIRQKLSGELRS